MSCSSTLFSMGTTSPGSVLRSSDQLTEVVSLAHVLLPPLADSSTIILENQPTVADLDLSELSELHLMASTQSARVSAITLGTICFLTFMQ